MSYPDRSRVDDYRIELLTRSDVPIGYLDGVTSASVTLNTNAELKASGSLSVDDVGQLVAGEPIDWLNVRIRPWSIIEGVWVPLGVYIPAVEGEDWDDGRRQWPVPLQGKLLALAEERWPDTYTCPAGTLVVSLVLQLIQEAGERQVTYTDSAERLRSPMSWDPATTKLRIINDLLDAIGYWSLWVDRWGAFRVEPYAVPTRRPVVYRFERGETAIHYPQWSRSQALAGVPNRVTAVSQEDGETAAMVETVTNEDPTSRFSYQARGYRWIDAEPLTGVEASSREVLRGHAERALAAASAPSATLEVGHDLIDGLWFNDVVEFSDSGHEARAVVETMDIDLPRGTVSARWREVSA